MYMCAMRRKSSVQGSIAGFARRLVGAFPLTTRVSFFFYPRGASFRGLERANCGTPHRPLSPDFRVQPRRDKDV